jgi:hypothetical protein
MSHKTDRIRSKFVVGNASGYRNGISTFLHLLNVFPVITSKRLLDNPLAKQSTPIFDWPNHSPNSSIGRTMCLALLLAEPSALLFYWPNHAPNSSIGRTMRLALLLAEPCA